MSRPATRALLAAVLGTTLAGCAASPQEPPTSAASVTSAPGGMSAATSAPAPAPAAPTSDAPASAAPTVAPTPSPTASPADPAQLSTTAAIVPPVPSVPPWSMSQHRRDPDLPFTTQTLATVGSPWALAFLPGGPPASPDALVTERGGRLILRSGDGAVRTVIGTPDVQASGQGGLADVILAPGAGTPGDGSAPSQHVPIYLSWVESAGSGATRGVVGRATLDRAAATLSGVRVIWRQSVAMPGDKQYSLRLLVAPDGQHLLVSSGERFAKTPAQDLGNDLGKILRLTLDGAPAAGNPFADRGGAAAEIWSFGHRNPLGLALDAAGNLWSDEMGPQGGDELNLIQPGLDYGWPAASNGSNYDGTPIPDHRAGDGYAAPVAWWNPVISPASLTIYSGSMFPDWRGDALIGALSGQALVRVDLDGTVARSSTAYPLGARIRDVVQAPDGALWVLQDGTAPAGGRLLRLTPR